jgi:HD-GYP domain-containing protein (c-di-GMP phosphodiesterase class II)
VVLRPGLSQPGRAQRRFWDQITDDVGRILEEEHQPFYVGNPWTGPEAGPFKHPVQVLAVSVLQKGSACGALALLQFDPERIFHSSDIRLLQSLSEQITLAAANTDLYADLQEFLMSTVKSLVGAIEAKDSYTSGHSERVNVMSMLLGRKLGLGRTEMETLRWASILHDVGKIGMPESILQKPGRLTPEEFEIIKQHPERGYKLLSPIRQLAEAAVCVRAHHEMMDGRGYPQGLRGVAIPRLSRIVAVADTYDALTSTRSYRSARTLEFATAEIRRVRGTQLDPEVVDCFLELVPFLREHQVMIQNAIDADPAGDAIPGEAPAPVEKAA